MDHLVNDHVVINGTRIAHGVHGAGRPVVLIHGTPSSSYIWRNVLPRLVETGHNVHVYDLLGFGLSERPWDPNTDTSVTGQVPILEELLNHWGLDEFSIIGHDIGGAIAKRFSILSQPRVRSLTLIDIVSYDSWPSERTRQQMQAGLDKMVNAADADHRAHFRDWLLSAVQDKERLSETSLEIYLEFICNPVGQASLFQHQIRHYNPRHTQELAPKLDELAKIPVQLIWGADDAWQVVDWAHRLKNDIPGSELHVLEACGHFAMEDQPEKIAGLVVDFLARKG